MTRMKLLNTLLVLAASAISINAQSLTYSGTPALLNNVTVTMHGLPNQPYVLAASDSAGPTVVAPLGSFDLGYPPIIVTGSIPGLPIVPSLDPSGNGSVSFDLPFNTSLIGTTWWFQGVYFDPQSPYGLTKTNSVNFTIANPLLAPTISSVTPNSGPSVGGSQVAIFGTNFLPGGTTVTVGGSPLGNMVVATPQLITGIIPPGTPGTSVDVAVTTLIGGISIMANAWSYQGNSAPSILTVTPDHAPITGGVAFTLTGQSLGAGTAVYVNGIPAITISQSTGIYVGILPAVSTPGYASILAVSPAGVASLGNTFRYHAVYDFGTGANGVFAPTANVILDTTNNAGVFNYTSFTIPSGVTVTGRGPNPLIIKCTGTVSISGTLDVSGEDAAYYPVTIGVPLTPPFQRAGAGGFDGHVTRYDPSLSLPPTYVALPFAILPAWNPTPSGNPYNTPSFGTGQYPYGSPTLAYMIGGSGGPSSARYCSFYSIALYLHQALSVHAGPGGGGAVSIQASVVLVAGQILANGGTGLRQTYPTCSVPIGYSQFSSSPGGAIGGSGGAIRIMTGSPLQATAASFQTTAGFDYDYSVNSLVLSGSGNGRWAVYSWNGTITYGTDGFIPPGSY